MEKFELNAVKNCEPNLLLRALRKHYSPTPEDLVELAEEGKPLNEYQQISLIRECNPNLLLKTFMK
jgi:hypothetical protein